MKRSRFRKMILYLILLVAVIAVCIGLKERFSDKETDRASDLVLARELEGYLQVIPLTPEETRKLILPHLGDPLTGQDAQILFEQLQLETVYREAAEEMNLKTEEPLTHARWSRLYEKILEQMGLSEEISEAKIQFQGEYAEEHHIITDQGNFEGASAYLPFSYGETYSVYIYQNKILGIKTSETETLIGKQKSDEPETVESALEIPQTIRVLLTQDNRQETYRSQVYVKGTKAVTVTAGEKTKTVKKGSVLNCNQLMKEWGVKRLSVKTEKEGRLMLTDARGDNASSPYRGAFLVYRNGKGSWVVNRLNLEAYLYGVVPGEMPERFCEEALKAQAICARTFACRQIEGDRYSALFADVNDTTDCQMYLPSKENNKTTQAVKDTKGQVLTVHGKLAAIYYYSTSCGYTAGMEVWKSNPVSHLQSVSILTDGKKYSDPDAFLRSKKVTAYDSDSNFFRWTARANFSKYDAKVKHTLQALVDSNLAELRPAKGKSTVSVDELGAFVRISVEERLDSGYISELALYYKEGSVHIFQEHAIRTAVWAATGSLRDKDGVQINRLSILPSAAFTIEEGKNHLVILHGGGLGHGIGMSQYGAHGMAKEGATAREILEKFYPGTVVME